MSAPRIDGITVKGVPLGVVIHDADLTAQRLDPALGNTATPIATLDGRLLSANADAMQSWCDRNGVLLAPHAKTALSADLIRMQLDRGAWGMTAALPRQVAVLWQYGVKNVLLANEVTDPAAIAWLAREAAHSGRSLRLYADSVDGVDLLSRVLFDAPGGEPLEVLIELGHPGGRSGARSVETALGVAEAVRAADGLRLAGVAGYEGTIGSSAEGAVIDAVDSFLRELRLLTGALQGRYEVDEPVVTAGGSLYFDRVAEILGPAAAAVGAHLVVRAGCTLIHDHGLYAAAGPFSRGVEGAPRFHPALSVWARAISTPEPTLTLLDAGRRDLSFDAGLPVPLERWRDGRASRLVGAEVTALSDQHAFVRHSEGSDLRGGDIVRLGISHPCTTLDRWSRIFLTDGGSKISGVTATAF